MDDETIYELWLALGSDPLATRTINGLRRAYPGQQITRDLIHRNRYDLRDIRTIGAKSLERIDKLLKETYGPRT